LKPLRIHNTGLNLNVLQEENVRKENSTDVKAQQHTLPPQHHHKAAHAHSARANHHHSNHHTSKYDHFEFVDKKHQATIFALYVFVAVRFACFHDSMQIHADPVPDPGQTLQSQKVEFLHEKYILSR
jgi:hypothetical protein